MSRTGSRIAYYLTNYARLFLPRFLAARAPQPVLTESEQGAIQRRLAYYLGNPSAWNCSDIDRWTSIGHLRKERQTIYFLDLYRYARSYPDWLKILYRFGDVTECQPLPTLVKSRPIGICTSSVLFKLDALRHFYFVNDRTPFEAKKSRVVWRGAAYKENRKRLLREFGAHPLCDVGHFGHSPSNIYDKPFMSIPRQLGYKFILSLEGNDVATNLKWILSSNSLCLMPHPKFETWFMEGTLVPGKHYVEIRGDYSDLIETINHYNTHTAEALAIIRSGQEYVRQFLNPNHEHLLCHLVLKSYFKHTGQSA
jgi:hypothetical protein